MVWIVHKHTRNMRGALVGIAGIVSLVTACSATSGSGDADGTGAFKPTEHHTGGRGGDGASAGGGSGGTAGSGGKGAAGTSGAAGQGSNPPDYSNIARISMPSTWTANVDGSWTYPAYETGPFNALGVEFYANHPDDYDLLVVYTEGDLADFEALSWSLQCTVGGIGVVPEQCPWTTNDAGSSGRLLQIIIMNAPHWWENDKSAPDIVVHETTHMWAAFVNLGGTPQPDYRLARRWLSPDIYTNSI